MDNKNNNIDLLEEDSKEQTNQYISTKEKFAYIFETLKQQRNNKKYIVINGKIKSKDNNTLYIEIFDNINFRNKQAVCKYENLGDMNIVDINYFFDVNSKHSFMIIPGTEEKEIIELNYKTLHPETRLKFSKISPTLSHYWNIKSRICEFLRINKGIKKWKK